MENQITVTDLALLKSLVEVASTRGAFKADELSTVGQVYDKLNLFLQQIVEQAEQSESAPSPTTTQTGESK
jgi:hypothetical protein